MLSFLVFWSLTYFICSLNLKDISNTRIPHNIIGRYSIEIIKLLRNFYQKFSFKLFFEVLDYVKCPMFVVISAILFNKKIITDTTAIVSYLAHYFPIWSGFRNDNKNFIGVIFTGFILDPITGISMIFAYLLSARSFGYTSVAITSSMLVGIIKTFIHIVFFDNNDYVEALFFIFFGILAIYKNHRVLIHIFGKSVKRDIKLYQIYNKNTTNTNIRQNLNYKNDKKKQNVEIFKKKTKKSNSYKNYKKFYTNNRKFAEDDKIYEK